VRRCPGSARISTVGSRKRVERPDGLLRCP
jgi:hypothetical protein